MSGPRLAALEVLSTPRAAFLGLRFWVILQEFPHLFESGHVRLFKRGDFVLAHANNGTDGIGNISLFLSTLFTDPFGLLVDILANELRHDGLGGLAPQVSVMGNRGRTQFIRHGLLISLHQFGGHFGSVVYGFSHFLVPQFRIERKR